MKILIVEDDVNSRVFLERSLLSQGYTVECAANGVQALEKAVLSPPDLIISDIMMPEMDGFELCRRVKANERFRAIPFVFYTATYIGQEDERLAMALGAARFLIKPMETAEFFRAISEVMEKHRTGYIPVRDHLPAEITELDRMQIQTYARKLDKKVRELEKERKALRKSKLLLEQKMIDLEKEIAERKKMEKEVQKRIKELEDFYDMAVGRELKMIELKNEIKELKQELTKHKKGE